MAAVEGEYGPICRSFIIDVRKVGDYNFDGKKDFLDVGSPDRSKPECKHASSRFSLGPDKYTFNETSVNPLQFSVWGWNDSIFSKAAAQKGGPLFGLDDLVEAPFGPKEEKVRGRIDKLVIEFDSSYHHLRNLASISTPYGGDIFELSALTLISPAEELEEQAQTMAQGLRNTKAGQRQEELLRYASRDHLYPPYQRELAQLETQLALAIEKQVSELNLDGPGKIILQDRVGEVLGFDSDRSVTELIRLIL